MKYLLLLLLLSACVAQPYVQPGMNKTEEKIVEKVLVQCWDNSTAESVDECPAKPVEKKVVAPVKVEKPVPIAEKLLIDARTKFTNYAFLTEDKMVIVVGSKVRHLFLKLSQVDNNPITDDFVG